MSLCDKLEKTQTKREKTRIQLTESSLAHLNEPDPATFQDDVRFVINNFPSLTASAVQINQIRQTILNLAVRGKLVEQKPIDGTGHELLLKLYKARSTCKTLGRVQKKKERDIISNKDKYLGLPSSWTWAKLIDIGHTQTGTTPSSSDPDLFGDFIPFVKPADLDGDEITYSGSGLSKIGIKHSRMAPRNTVLMVCIGATLGKVNKTSRAVCFNQQINSLTPYVEGLTDFVAIALKASGFQELAWSKAGTGTLPIISKGKWEVLPTPLPPLAEQQRIVAKVNELMSLCDRLETNLSKRDFLQNHLLDALVHEVLVPAASMKQAA